VLTGLLVVLLVEAADEFLEDGPHAVVVETVRAEIDVRGSELLDQRAERVRFREPRNLVPELEVVEDVLNVWREAVQIRLEIGLELLLAGASLEVAQRELRRVVERLAGGLTKRLVLVRDPGLVEGHLHVENRLLGRFEDGIEATKHRHRQDDVAVLPANVQVSEDIVCNAPDEIGDPAQLTLFHITRHASVDS
jgi:hypothetical protein